MAGSDAVKLGELGEDRLIATLLRNVPPGEDTLTGPGDDCAVLRGTKKNERLLLKTDAVVEGVHFLREHDPARVGWKALCRVISDIGAMGGTPRSAVITIFSPADRELAYWRAFYRGLGKAAKRYAVGIVGGETTRAQQVAISVAMLGVVDAGKAVLRSGGRAGDRLFVSGRLGGSLAGKHLDFQPRVTEGAWLAAKGFATAMMDLSDGLAADLPRLAAASGCGFQITKSLLPRNRGVSVEQALSDGEDYELLLAVHPLRCSALLTQWKKRFPRLPLTEIGTLTKSGTSSTPLPGGFDHFFHCQPRGKKAS